MKTIKLPCFGIEIELCEGHFKGEKSPRLTGTGTITSNLHEDIKHDFVKRTLPSLLTVIKPWSPGIDGYESAINAIESLILAHACAGIDIECSAYIKGIEDAVAALIFKENKYENYY